MTTCFDMEYGPFQILFYTTFCFSEKHCVLSEKQNKKQNISGCIISEKCHRSLAYFLLKKKTCYDMDN